MQQGSLSPPRGHLRPGLGPSPGNQGVLEGVGGQRGGGDGVWPDVALHATPPHTREKMSVGVPEPEPPHSLPCCGPGTAPGLGAGVPLLTEDMQALTLRTLAASDVTKHYELVRELGKGTYGKVDLVAYKGTGECVLGGQIQDRRLSRGQETSREAESVAQGDRIWPEGALGGGDQADGTREGSLG